MSSVMNILNSPWAITPDMYQQMHGIYASYLQGEKKDIAQLSAELGRPVDNSHRAYEVIDGVAVIPVHGVMAKRANLFQAISGGASTQLLIRDLEQALADNQVHSIITEFDSPGGAVDGLPEFANTIRSARGKKPIVSLASGLMASAAVWSGTAADEVYASDETTIVGSIGVVATHVDVSQLEKARGIKTTEIYAGRYKRIDTAYEPLSQEGRASIQDRVDYLYGLFVDAVAQNRGVSPDDVLDRMADGKLFVGQQAIDIGLIDGIKTRSEIIASLNDRQKHRANPSLIKSGNQPRRSAANADKPTTTEAVMPTPEETLTPDASDSEQPQMTAEFVAENHPDIAAHFRTEGATAETQRVKDVLAQSMPGHEALVNGLAFDGKTTAGEAAMAVNQAMRDAAKKVGADFTADAPEAVDVEASDDGDTSAESATVMTPKEKAAEARKLVDAAEARGEKLTVSAAMKMLEAQ